MSIIAHAPYSLLTEIALTEIAPAQALAKQNFQINFPGRPCHGTRDLQINR
jgi:hypothetical protein